MRDFKFTEQEHPTMANFNARFDAIATLANGLGNEYVWEKIASQVVYDSINVSNYGIITSGVPKPATYYYSDSFHIDGTNFVLTDPQSKTVTTSDWAQADTYSFLKGKYFIINDTSASKLPFIPSDATISRADSGGQVIVSASVATVYKNIRTEYTTVGYANSPDPNAYPPAVSDGYTYTALGQLGQNMTKIQTGSYIGTQTFGSSNPNTLTFDFIPKIVIISTKVGNTSVTNTGFGDAFYVWGNSQFYVPDSNTFHINRVSTNGKTMTWYHGGNSYFGQLNADYTYFWVAIG